MGQFRGVELDDVELTGPRLLLRRWRESDAARVYELMQDDAIARFLPVPLPYTRDDAREFVTEHGHEGRGAGTGLGCAVVRAADGQLVGSCALRLGAEGEVGYWIGAPSRGAGYAAEATRMLADFAYRLGLYRVWLACDLDNLASARAAMAAGFRFEGVARGSTRTVRGQLMAFDDAVFARTAADNGDPITPAFPRLLPGELSDGVLSLRGLRGEDASAWAEAEDTESARWNFSGTPLTPTEIATYAHGAPLDWLVGTSARLAMIDVESGRFAGHLNLRRAGPPQVGGVGYGVHPDFRGRGYTTRALRMLATWAFESASFARLELGAKTGNVASQRAAAKAGFEPDGIRKGRLRNGDGTFADEVRFALLNPAIVNSAEPNASLTQSD